MEYFAKVWPYFGVLLGFGLGFYSARRRATEKRAADLEFYKAGFLNPLEVEHEQEILLQKLEGRIDAIQMQHPDWTFSQVIRSEAGRETMFQWLLAHQWTAFRLESLSSGESGSKGINGEQLYRISRENCGTRSYKSYTKPVHRPNGTLARKKTLLNTHRPQEWTNLIHAASAFSTSPAR